MRPHALPMISRRISICKPSCRHRRALLEFQTEASMPCYVFAHLPKGSQLKLFAFAHARRNRRSCALSDCYQKKHTGRTCPRVRQDFRGSYLPNLLPHTERTTSCVPCCGLARATRATRVRPLRSSFGFAFLVQPVRLRSKWKRRG